MENCSERTIGVKSVEFSMTYRLPLLLGLISFLGSGAFADEPKGIEKLDPNFSVREPGEEVEWYDLQLIGTEGQGWTDTQSTYDRLPARAEGVVRDPVWKLSNHSAGICARFISDSTSVSARWVLRKSEIAMNHMAATGVSGLDLYVRGENGWRWVAVGRPKEVTNEVELLTGIPGGFHEYLLYLPLYNGVEKVELGIVAGKFLGKAPINPKKPIVFYGTSITQGGCASRPGMAHPAILGRRLDTPIVNLGFSGNGKMDPEIGDLLTELDPSVYVIECTPNMEPETIAERTVPLVKKLRTARPETPILLVESIHHQREWFIDAYRDGVEKKNRPLKESYEQLLDEGIENLHYLASDSFLGDDSEGTVDGVHPTDLGFLRIAEAFEPVLRRLTE